MATGFSPEAAGGKRAPAVGRLCRMRTVSLAGPSPRTGKRISKRQRRRAPIRFRTVFVSLLTSDEDRLDQPASRGGTAARKGLAKAAAIGGVLAVAFETAVAVYTAKCGPLDRSSAASLILKAINRCLDQQESCQGIAKAPEIGQLRHGGGLQV